MSIPLTNAADQLYRNAAPIRAVQGTEVNIFRRAIDALEQLADRIDAPIALVGGLAGIHHRAVVTTLDIDIVVPAEKLDVLLAEAPACGLTVKSKSDEGWHQLAYSDASGSVNIEVVPPGRKSPRDPDYAPVNPSPQELGVEKGVGYASFAGWAAMKLVANRDKDRYHLIEALKQATQEQVAEVVQKLRPLPAVYLKEFQRLLQAAEDESQEKW